MSMMYLNADAWNQKYEELNASSTYEFFKFEMLPVYNDYGIYDWNAIQGDTLREIIIKSQTSIASLKEKILPLIEKGFKINRVRYLEFPLSKYILRQFSVYKLYVEMGVKIDILEGKSAVSDINSIYFRDFLLFDDKALLLIDNPNGCFSGGLFSNEEKDIAPFIDIKNKISKRSVPFEKYIHDFNISFNNLTQG